MRSLLAMRPVEILAFQKIPRFFAGAAVCARFRLSGSAAPADGQLAIASLAPLDLSGGSFSVNNRNIAWALLIADETRLV
jgi:hypothetical protein